jgi:hypothetical protein
VSRRGQAAALTLVTLAACKSEPAPVGPGARNTAASNAVAAEVRPVDHLAPGELLEGTQHAFGLTLPKELPVEAAFVNVVYATGPVLVHSVARYFRPRLEEGALRESESVATFEHVRVRGKPGLELTIRILAGAEGTRVEIRDTTLAPTPDLPDDAARWRQIGMTPQGRPLDPTHLD